MSTNKVPAVGAAGGANGSTGNASFCVHSTTDAAKAQAPSGALPAYMRGDLIMVAGRHLCSVRDGELRRTFDATRELLRGGLCFRCDVLTLAERAGATVITASERNTGAIYTVSMADFRRLAWAYTHPDFGRQLGLALIHWRAIEPTREQGPRQLALFGGQR